VDELLCSFCWYDALGINQHDLDERSQQVTIFGRIYRSASQVVVYLGPESPHDLQAIALLRYIHDHFSSQLNAFVDVTDNGVAVRDGVFYNVAAT
jgi:hypothetical protein